jgi:hypothetical protein
MTTLQVSERTLAALDRVRAARGIRTRAKALEVVLTEIAPPENEEELSPASARRLRARLEKAKTEGTVGLSDIKKHLGMA